MLDSNKPLILLLGDVDREGVTSKLAATGRQYKKKLLDSSVENWKSILKYFDDFSISEILVKLTPYTYSLIASDDYRNISNELLKRIAEFPNIFFVHESLLTGIENLDFKSQDNKVQAYIYEHYLKPPNEETRLLVNGMFESINLNIIPYKRNAELSLMALTFLNQTEQNLLFRFYIPSDRMWSLEADKLLQLFRNYLSKVSGLNVRLDQYRTEQGIIFEFHGDENTRSPDISKEFDDFSTFMDLCISNPNSAEILLRDKSLNSKVIHEIIERYSKEAKRLVLDLKHERERKFLGIRHRLESELAEMVAPDFNWQSLNLIVDASIPRIDGIGSALGIYNSASQLSSASNLTVNISPQIINTVKGVVAKEIVGDQYINKDTKKLLELIQKYGNNKSAELVSAVYELSDKSAPQPGRLTARQKLKKFLLSVGGCTEDSSMGALQAYVESQLGL